MPNINNAQWLVTVVDVVEKNRVPYIAINTEQVIGERYKKLFWMDFSMMLKVS